MVMTTVAYLAVSPEGQGADRNEALCIHCNKCMPTIYQGTYCVLVPADQRPGSAP
jgi:hypothetical protein